MKRLISLLGTAIPAFLLVLPVAGQAPQQTPPGQPMPTQPRPFQPKTPTPNQPGTLTPQQPQPIPGTELPKKEEQRPPAAEYAIAMMATLGILVIVCKPTRKR